MNKLIEAIERKIFAEIAVICYDHLIKNDNFLRQLMIDDYLQHGKLQDSTVEKIKKCLK